MRKILLFSLISIQGIFSLSDTYAQCSSAPTISTPTATSITTTSATIGATLVGNGGGSGCDATYGVRYSTTTPVGASNEIIDGTTSSDGVVFTANLAGLTPGTKYYYTGYATNTEGTVTTSDNGSVFFYTVASSPGAYPAGFSLLATVDGNEIDLTFPKASTLPMDAHGYLVLRREGSNPDLSGVTDGNAPAGTYYLVNGNINDSTATTFTDNTAIAGVTYHYALVPYRVVNDGGPISSTYNYGGTISPFATASIPLSTTFTEITGGIAPSPLASSSTEQAILGFSVTSNGAPNFTAINIQVTSSALNKFSNAYLYESANNTFDGGDNPVASVTDNLTGTQIQLSGFSVALSSSPKYFFIVVDVQDTVSASSPTLTPSFTNSNVTVSGGGTVTVTGTTITGETYSFADASPPTITATSPAFGTQNLSVNLNTYSITFNEPVTLIGDNSDAAHMIRIFRITATAAFVDTIEVGNINVVGNVVTFTSAFQLSPNIDYAIRIGSNVFEDAAGNNFAGISDNTWDYETESSPNIISLSTSTRCIGDQLTITGERFTGTGGSGNTKPQVRINGNIVHPDSIKSFNATTITLIVPPNAATGNVQVRNNDNNLLSDTESLTVHPQILTNLTVTPATLNPAQNTSVNIQVFGTQSSSYSYALRLLDAPAGYSLAPIATVHTLSGNNGTIVLNTSEGPDPDLTHIGDYEFDIRVSRTGCTTQTLTNTPFILTVASLDVEVSATETSVCQGSSSVLIGSTSGGTGFYQFSWVGPNGFTSSSSSPTISPSHPAGTGWYICTLSDNSANTDKDSVYITTFPVSPVSFQPVGNAPNVQTEYTNQNQLFELNASPTQLISAGAKFSGAGVVALADSNKYYFNPQLAGNGIHTITYEYDNGNCVTSTTLQFRVSSTFLENFESFYCANDPITTELIALSSPTGTNYLSTYYNGWTHTRLRFMRYEYNPVLGFYEFKYYDPITQPSLDPLNFVSANGGRPQYRLDVPELVANHGIAPPNAYYYIVVFASDPVKIADPVLYPGYVDEAVLYNFFRIVPLGTQPNITGINEGANICSNATPINIGQSINGYSVVNFQFTDPTYNPSILTGPNRFDPTQIASASIEIPVTLRLTYNDFNGCQNTTTRNFTWVRRPDAPISNDSSYCQIVSGSGQPLYLRARPNPGTLASTPNWYTSDPAGGALPVDQVNFLFTVPGIDGTVAGTTQVYVTQTYKGCEGATEQVLLTVNPAPSADITRDAICEDRIFNLNGPEESTGVPYPSYQWTFGDGVSTTVLNDSTVTHNYGPGTGSAPFTISLTVTSSQGCKNSDTDFITVGLNPKPNFTYTEVCDNDLTKFVGSTDIAVANYQWDFGDGTLINEQPSATAYAEGGTVQNPHHTFTSGPGIYDVTVTSYTAAGCFNSLTKPVTILEYLTYTSDNPYLMSTEEGGMGYWRVEDVAGNSTWEFAQPTTPSFDDFTSPAWVTNATGNYLPSENAYLNSPCFNITAIQRPVITLDFALDTDENRDGVVLEVSKDNGITWTRLGEENTGINWFNTSGFFTGTIGSSTKGWSGSSLNLDDNIGNTNIVQGRRSLDNLISSPPDYTISPAERAKLRFRFAFKTDDFRELEGFAFNNLKIESRNRTLLIENFTNENSPAYASNNTAYGNISDGEAVKIQYHVGYPTHDNQSRINQADQLARAAFYGITLTNSSIPRVYIDALSAGDFGAWSIARFDRRSLVTSPLTMTIESQDTTAAGYIKAKVTIEALQNIPLIGKPVLQLAVVEKENNSNNNDFVLRKFFGSPAGKPLAQITTFPITQGEIIEYTDRIYLDDLRINFDSLSLVAFIQDEVTKEVYQAAIELLPQHLPDPDIITDIEDPTYGERIEVYPNPANETLAIILPAEVTKDTPVTILDSYGRTVYSNQFKSGKKGMTVNTTSYSPGLYFLQLTSPEGKIIRKKVMVAH